MKLFDTHTHFDVPEFDHDREKLAHEAKQKGVEGLILIGFLQSRFDDLLRVHQQINSLKNAPKSYLAPGLHPLYIEQHTSQHLKDLELFLQKNECIAIGEIGLDTFLKQHKQSHIFERQVQFFEAQLELAQRYQKPVLLHIRKAHAQALHILKKHEGGGIAHAFSGGIQEAKAFVNLGFKLGVTGQITNPNAKKLHDAVQAVGISHLVIETDCPDMTPLCCSEKRNTPANLPYVLQALSHIFNVPEQTLAIQLWENTQHALHLRTQ